MKTWIWLLLCAGLAAAACVDIDESTQANSTFLVSSGNTCYHLINSNITINLTMQNTVQALDFGDNYTSIDNVTITAPTEPAAISCLQNLTLRPTFGQSITDSATNITCIAPDFPERSAAIVTNANWSANSVVNLFSWDDSRTLSPGETWTALGARVSISAPAATTCPSCELDVDQTLKCGETYINSAANVSIDVDCRRNMTWSLLHGGSINDTITNITATCAPQNCTVPPTTNVVLDFAKCYEWSTIKVCSPAYPKINEAVDMKEDEVKAWPSWNLTVNCRRTVICETPANINTCRQYCHDNMTYPVMGDYTYDGVMAYFKELEKTNNTLRFFNCTNVISVGPPDNKTTYCADNMRTLCPNNIFDGDFGTCFQSLLAGYEQRYTSLVDEKNTLTSELNGYKTGGTAFQAYSQLFTYGAGALIVGLLVAGTAVHVVRNRRVHSERHIPVVKEKGIEHKNKGDQHD